MGKSLLFLVTGLTLITGIIQVRNSDRIEAIPNLTNDYYKAQQAKNLSKSLIDNAVEIMKVDNDWAGSISLTDVVDTLALASRDSDARRLLAIGDLELDQLELIEEQHLQDVLTVGSFSLDMEGTLNSYTQSSENIPQNNSVDVWNEYKVLLVSSTQYDDIEVTTEVLMQRDSFSKYSYMTQSELSSSGSRIWFMTDDNIYGPIHTNGEFAMAGTPSFYGLVTSPNEYVEHSTIATEPNFYGGENFNAPTKEAPSSYEISRLVDAADAGGKRYDSDIDVLFYTDGDGNGFADISYGGVEQTNTTCTGWGWSRTCTTTTTIVGGTEETVEIADLDNPVISTSGTATVVGVVQGGVTLHSEEEIEILGDITYYTNPLVDSTSSDLLGLVSEGDVILDQNAHSYTGSQDVDIHATIMALNTSFYVENYSSGGAKGTINLLGGITQQNRGAVGTFNSSSGAIVSGYSKNYQYDNRLKAQIPPSFPRESIFSIVYWKEEINKISD